jgi:ankyrin repeat protein
MGLGFTPIIQAARNNPNPEVISTLLKAGANVNTKDGFLGLTPLMHAVEENKNPEIIITLLKAGADAKMKDSDGKTAFDYAKKNENLKGTKAYWALNDAQY